ncbi:MAG: hypothetical protein QXY11_05075 [Desulfurococcaceae archaeon]
MSMHTRKRKLSVKGSTEIFSRINLILAEFLPAIYEYNSMIKHTGFYLKPVHITTRRLQDGTYVKYYYYGRYWYRLEKVSPSRIKWVYVGREKPSPQLPDPPPNILEGVVVKKYNGEVEIEFASEELFREISKRLYQV